MGQFVKGEIHRSSLREFGLPARERLQRDLTIATVARLLGFPSAREFAPHLNDYLARGLPAPDPITGRVDPVGFERWRRLRAPHLFPELTPPSAALDPRKVWAERRGAWRDDAA